MEYLTHKGERFPLLGFGTWCVGDDAKEKHNEIATMQYGMITYGMTLVDTAEMYGMGKSERVVGAFLQETERSKIYLISKIFPHNANVEHFESSLQNSLKALGTDYLDLYLLHWRGDSNLQIVVDLMEDAKKRGLIRNWGVSNFDVSDMEDLFRCKGGENCFANEILYNISARGVEFDLLEWDRRHEVLNIIYSPLANNAKDRETIAKNLAVRKLCEQKQISPEALMLSFVLRSKSVLAIFKTGSIEHLQNNMAGCFSEWTQADMDLLESAYPAPTRKVPLEKI